MDILAALGIVALIVVIFVFAAGVSVILELWRKS